MPKQTHRGFSTIRQECNSHLKQSANIRHHLSYHKTYFVVFACLCIWTPASWRNKSLKWQPWDQWKITRNLNSHAAGSVERTWTNHIPIIQLPKFVPICGNYVFSNKSWLNHPTDLRPKIKPWEIEKKEASRLRLRQWGRLWGFCQIKRLSVSHQPRTKNISPLGLMRSIHWRSYQFIDHA